jgi:hypothetical protein
MRIPVPAADRRSRPSPEGWRRVTDLAGAVLYGDRPRDAQARKRVKSLGWLSGGGFAIWVAVELLGMVKSNIAAERADHRQDITELVAELRDQSRAVRGLTEELADRGKRDDAHHADLMLELVNHRGVARMAAVRPEAPGP